MEYLLIIPVILLIGTFYLKGMQDEENRNNKSKALWHDHYEQQIQNLKDQIKEIEGRPENWKNKIAEAKETFKHA